MNETEFQALFESYERSSHTKEDNPVPQKIHLMVYNYAQRRHQQTSDVSADFYLHMLGRLKGMLDRYDPRKAPFYQYMAVHLNFEFRHFLRRRRLPRSQVELLSLEDLAARHVELQMPRVAEEWLPAELFATLKNTVRIYAKLTLAYPLTYGELRQLINKKPDKTHRRGWSIMRAYRLYQKFADEKRQQFLTERDRLLLIMMRNQQQIKMSNASDVAAIRRRESARKKFFSMDTRIPIRIVADVTAESIATAQRQMKSAIVALKGAHAKWERQNLIEKDKKSGKRQFES